MPKRERNPYADYEFIRAYHIERREAEAAFDVVITSSIVTATRPDRVLIRMEAVDTRVKLPNPKPLCAVERSWPDGREATFSVALFQTAVALTRLVEDSRRDLWRLGARQQHEG
jgi:hypothetical protein